MTWLTTVLPFTTLVTVVVVTPDALVVATACETRGPVAPCAAAAVPTPVVVADAELAAAAEMGKAWCASANVVAPAPTTSAAAVQFDIRRT